MKLTVFLKKIQIFMLLLGWYENSKSFNTENVVTMIDCELSLASLEI